MHFDKIPNKFFIIPNPSKQFLCTLIKFQKGSIIFPNFPNNPMHYHKIPNRSHNSPNRPGKPNQNHLQSQYKFNRANQSPVSQNKFDCPNQSHINFLKIGLKFWKPPHKAQHIPIGTQKVPKDLKRFQTRFSKSQIKLSRFLLVSKWFLIGRVGSK